MDSGIVESVSIVLAPLCVRGTETDSDCRIIVLAPLCVRGTETDSDCRIIVLAPLCVRETVTVESLSLHHCV